MVGARSERESTTWNLAVENTVVLKNVMIVIWTVPQKSFSNNSKTYKIREQFPQVERQKTDEEIEAGFDGRFGPVAGYDSPSTIWAEQVLWRSWRHQELKIPVFNFKIIKTIFDTLFFSKMMHIK